MLLLNGEEIIGFFFFISENLLTTNLFTVRVQLNSFTREMYSSKTKLLFFFSCLIRKPQFSCFFILLKDSF